MISLHVPKVVPWRDFQEWSAVYQFLFGLTTKERQLGVKMVNFWRTRANGKLPIAIEGTSGLVECGLMDIEYQKEKEERKKRLGKYCHRIDNINGNNSKDGKEVELNQENENEMGVENKWNDNEAIPLPLLHALISLELEEGIKYSEYSLRRFYSQVITKTITGLMEMKQKGIFADSMRNLATQSSLPVWLIDIRHDATHSDLPSLSSLRLSAQQLLEWLELYYWRKQQEEVLCKELLFSSLLRSYFSLAQSIYDKSPSNLHQFTSSVNFQEDIRSSSIPGINKEKKNISSISKSRSSDNEDLGIRTNNNNNDSRKKAKTKTSSFSVGNGVSKEEVETFGKLLEQIGNYLEPDTLSSTFIPTMLNLPHSLHKYKNSGSKKKRKREDFEEGKENDGTTGGVYNEEGNLNETVELNNDKKSEVNDNEDSFLLSFYNEKNNYRKQGDPGYISNVSGSQASFHLAAPDYIRLQSCWLPLLAHLQSEWPTFDKMLLESLIKLLITSKSWDDKMPEDEYDSALYSLVQILLFWINFFLSVGWHSVKGKYHHLADYQFSKLLKLNLQVKVPNTLSQKEIAHMQEVAKLNVLEAEFSVPVLQKISIDLEWYLNMNSKEEKAKCLSDIVVPLSSSSDMNKSRKQQKDVLQECKRISDALRERLKHSSSVTIGKRDEKNYRSDSFSLNTIDRVDIQAHVTTENGEKEMSNSNPYDNKRKSIVSSSLVPWTLYGTENDNQEWIPCPLGFTTCPNF